MSEDPNQFIPEAERLEIEALYRHIENGPHAEPAPIRCRLKFHKWSKWWTIKSGQIIGGQENTFHVGQYVEQKRCCLRCYRVVLRKQDIT